MRRIAQEALSLPGDYGALYPYAVAHGVTVNEVVYYVNAYEAGKDSGLELTGMPRQKVLDQLVAELMEKYQRATEELGLAKESQVRELLGQFAGQEVDGSLLGLAGPVRLPSFDRAVPYRSADGQVEVDALAENGGRWAVEIKWRGRLAGRQEVQKLAWVARSLAARAWFISCAGFTPEALEYAQREGVMTSTRKEIEVLAGLVQP